MNSRIKQQIDFLKEIDKLKHIERKIKLNGRKLFETDAEHAWHVAMFVLLFEKDLPKFDVAKTLKIILIHDLVEIYAGDTFAYDKLGKSNQKEREKKAAKKLFSQLPQQIEKELWQLFLEFENKASKEAKIADSFDKLQPILQNILNGGQSWKKYNVSINDIDSYKRPSMIHDKIMMEIYESFLKDIEKKKLAKK